VWEWTRHLRSVDIRQATGCRLGRAVKDARGRILLAAGTCLTPGLCEALLRRGFLQVYVFDGLADDLAPRDAIAESTRALAQTAVHQCFQAIERGQGDDLPLRQALCAVDQVLEDLTAARDAVLELSALRSVSDYTYVHSVHVCVYSLMIGQALGLSGPDLRQLGVGALLHDVGKVLCADLCNRPGPLRPEEWARIRQHPIDGFEMLRRHHELPLLAAHVAYQHHERLDGSGYPRGLRDGKILSFARIVAVADVYDAMTADRPHCRAQPPERAMAVLRDGAGVLFDAEAVQTLMRRLALYPTGTPVLLADGTVAVVVRQGADPSHPVVRPLGRAGRVFREREEVAAVGERAVAQVLTHWPAWLRSAAPA
jgi:HD-GYP domain-containing protein (c-di-GMP phosphodiesterase class II)